MGGELIGDGTIPSLVTWVEAHFVDDGVRTIRIDLTEVTEIDLEGVAALGVLLMEAAKRGKELEVDGASGQVRHKLDETGLGPHLRGTGAA